MSHAAPIRFRRGAANLSRIIAVTSEKRVEGRLDIENDFFGKKWGRAILVTGHGRGGTTWLGDILKHAENAAYIFEPLTASKHPPTSQSELLSVLLSERDYWMSRSAADCGRFANLAAVTDRHTTELYDGYFAGAADTLIVKQPCIEWVPMLRDLLKPDKIVYIERNPLAILNSYDRSNLYDAWRVGKMFQFCLNEVSRDWPQFASIMQRADGDQELQILAMCCVAHRIARACADDRTFIIVRYEDLAEGGQWPRPNSLNGLVSRLHLAEPFRSSFFRIRRKSVFARQESVRPSVASAIRASWHHGSCAERCSSSTS